MNIAVIFAGGIGSRMHSKELPKQFLMLRGKPVIIHTLEQFENHDEIDAIVISCIEDRIQYLNELLEKYNIRKVKKIVPGGKTGQLSIYNGLCAAESVVDKEEKNIVLIHDGVRPLINSKLITDNIRSVKENGSAITCVKAKETILLVENEDNAEINTIPDRNCVRLAEAPQSFFLNDIMEVERRAINEGLTNAIDSCSLMKKYGKKIYLIEGPTENIKITTPDDFYIMRAILDAKENAQIHGIEE